MGVSLGDKFVNFGGGILNDGGKLLFFLRGEFAEDKVGVADGLAEFIIGGTEAQTGKFGGAKVLDSRFETIITAGGTAAFCSVSFFSNVPCTLSMLSIKQITFL